MKFFAEEVEAVLEWHPKVGASRVRPIAHARLGEIALAEIEPCDAADPPHWPELIALCREHGDFLRFRVARRTAVIAPARWTSPAARSAFTIE